MEKETDIYRDTWIRYLGYCNELGESVRHLVHKKVVTASYAVATAYCTADTVDKSYKKYKQGESIKNIGITAGDVFIWQMLASVFIPGFTINRITYFSRRLLKKQDFHKQVAKFLPTVIGIASIPVIIHPIDAFTDFLMDKSYRQYFKNSS